MKGELWEVVSERDLGEEEKDLKNSVDITETSSS